MTAEVAVPATTPVEIAPTPLSGSTRWRILFYLSVLIVLIGFGAPFGGLIEVPIRFFLKNKLHLQAHEVANFLAIAAIPLYLSSVFGFARDRWNPLGMGDRGFMVVFGSVCAATYVLFAFIPVTYLTLMIAVVLLSSSFLFVMSAQNGLTSAAGQQHVMSGQVAAVANTVLSFPVLASLVAGGLLSDQLEGKNADQAARILFLVGAAIMAAIALYGLWKPKSVFDNIHSERNSSIHPLSDLKRLARHWPVYPALFIWLLWCFAPGSQTPLQFYLQNTLHAKDAAYADFQAIFAASFIPTYLLFGYLCTRVKLRSLLFWGTVVAVPQMTPLLFIHSVNGALLAAAPIGLMGGVCTAAYTDLVIRSCPKGLQGAVLMMFWAIYYFASRFGDILGTNLYDHYGGFTVCVIAITVVYAAILPVLWLVPRRLTATADGEAPEVPFTAD